MRRNYGRNYGVITPARENILIQQRIFEEERAIRDRNLAKRPSIPEGDTLEVSIYFKSQIIKSLWRAA